MVRILHTADWHIGHTFFGYDRTTEHLHFFDWLSTQLNIHKVDVLLVSGDIFDSMNPSAASQRMFFNFMRKAKKENPHLQMIFIAGSHDSPGRLEAPTPLLQDLDITIKGQPFLIQDKPLLDDLIIPLAGDSGEVEALCLLFPHMHYREIPLVGGTREFCKMLINHALEKKNDEQSLVSLGYLNVVDDINSVSYDSGVLSELEPVSSDIFAESFVYTGLGYDHQMRTVAGHDNVRYAGSPLAMSFEERDSKRGGILVTIEPGKDTKIEELAYSPLIKLLSIPGDTPLPEDEIVHLLNELPERTDDLHLPFLELRVLVSNQSPQLRLNMEQILKNKAARLARIITSWKGVGEQMTEEEIMTMGLQDMTPLQIARITYEKAYQTAMPNDLQILLHELFAMLH